jgi:hypothetical protein
MRVRHAARQFRFDFLASVLTSFILWVALRRRTVLRVAVIVALIAVSWPFLLRATLHESTLHNQEVELRAARDEQVTEEEWLADGTGDNVGALMFGWFPVAVGVLLALPVDFLLRRRRAAA